MCPNFWLVLYMGSVLDTNMLQQQQQNENPVGGILQDECATHWLPGWITFLWIVLHEWMEDLHLNGDATTQKVTLLAWWFTDLSDQIRGNKKMYPGPV